MRNPLRPPRRLWDGLLPVLAATMARPVGETMVPPATVESEMAVVVVVVVVGSGRVGVVTAGWIKKVRFGLKRKEGDIAVPLVIGTPRTRHRERGQE